MWTNNEQDFLLVGGPGNPTGYILIDDTVSGVAGLLFIRTFILLPEHPSIDKDPRDPFATPPLAGAILFDNQQLTINSPENVGSIYMGFSPFIGLNAYGKSTAGNTRTYGAVEVGPALLAQAFVNAGSPTTAWPWANNVPGGKLVTLGQFTDLNNNSQAVLRLIGDIDKYVGGALPVLTILNNQTGATAHIAYDNGNFTFANGNIFFFANGDITQLAGTLSPNALAIPAANYGPRIDNDTINKAGTNGLANTISRSDHVHQGPTITVHDQAAYSNATTGFTDIPGMSAVLAANGIYEIEFYGAYNGSVTTTGLKLNIPAFAYAVLSGTSEIFVTTGQVAPSFTDLYNAAGAAFAHTGPTVASAGTNFFYRQKLYVKNGAALSTCKLQAAASAAGTIALPAGGYAMKVTRLA